MASWPTDDPGISRLERKQLQKALLARGYDIGEADGLIGTSTRKAIQAEQKRLGLTPADGRAGRKIDPPPPGHQAGAQAGRHRRPGAPAR